MPYLAERKEGPYILSKDKEDILVKRGIDPAFMEDLNYLSLPKIESAIKKTERKAYKKPYNFNRPEKFLVRIPNDGVKPYQKVFQAVKFPKGKVVVGYDVWRMVEGDISNDEHRTWYDSIDELPESYMVIKNNKLGYYRQF